MILDKPFILTEKVTEGLLKSVKDQQNWMLIGKKEQSIGKSAFVMYYRNNAVISVDALAYLTNNQYRSLNDIVYKLIDNNELVYAEDYFDPDNDDKKYVDVEDFDIYMYSGVFEHKKDIGICLTDTGVVKVWNELSTHKDQDSGLLRRHLSYADAVLLANK